MTLLSFGTNVSMSATQINEEIGESGTSMLDFQGAATSFSGILDTETTDGYGALAVEMREFYGKTFSAGSGTYGTRNAHTIRYLQDASDLRAYGEEELVYAAESVVAPAITGPVTMQSATKYVDDYIDSDLTVGDDVYNSSGATDKWLVSSYVKNGSTYWFNDETANDVFELGTGVSSGEVLSVIPRKPATPTITLISKDDSSITISVDGDTRVARTLRVYQDGVSDATYTSTGVGGSGFTGGSSDDSSRTKQHTFTSLSDGTSYALKARYENAYDNGDDSNTLNITTDTATYSVTISPDTHGGDGTMGIETFISDVVIGGPDNPWIYLSTGNTSQTQYRVAVSTDGGSTYGSYGSYITPSGNDTYATSKKLGGTTDTHFRIQFKIDTTGLFSATYVYTIYNREDNAGNFQRNAQVTIEETEL